MKPPKVVFDTNIFISAIIFGGNPEKCFEMAREGKMGLFTSREILLELARKLDEKFGMRPESIERTIEGIINFAEVVKPRFEVSVIEKDETDNKVLEVAKKVKANFIISGDKKHILPLNKFEETKILSAAEFLKQF
ncbi:MAG: putative toxin-antitoxin system toxin component, PIN family [Patescibacteria group bacterium]